MVSSPEMAAPRPSALRGYLLVLAAASLWATIGPFYRILTEEYGLSKVVVVAYRTGLAALALLLALALVQPAALRIRLRDLPFFLLFGLVGVAGFAMAYMAAISAGSVAQAAILLYTAPVWIALWSLLIERERLEGPRILALMLALVGCALVAQAYDPSRLGLNGGALVYGLLSGIGYAAYNLFSSGGVRRGYDAWTVVLYAFGAGSATLFALAPIGETLGVLRTPAVWPALLGAALLTSLLGPLLFTLGLSYVRVSTASILATMEPVVAALLAWAILGETLALPQVAGGVCVLIAVTILLRHAARRAQGSGNLVAGAPRDSAASLPAALSQAASRDH